MKKELEITKSTPNEKGGVVITLKHETEVEFAGITKMQKETFYMSAKKAPEVGTKVQLDMDMFQVKQYPYIMPDGSLPLDDEGQEIADEDGNPLLLKWLHLK